MGEDMFLPIVEKLGITGICFYTLFSLKKTVEQNTKVLMIVATKLGVKETEEK
jgi:hypothetical protein